jgi:AcrR family transcriptional regulator
VRGEATRRRIVDAARDVLLEHGHGGASTRAVADRAGVRLSLVHYHFGGKQGLLLEVLARENKLLLERQRELYAAPGPLADKWRTACDFLDEDVRSGYVRVLWELWAAGLADESLAAGWRSAMGGWRRLLESVCEEWAADLELELPLSPRAVATLVGNLFQGIEVELLAGVPPDDAPHREVLDAIGALIARAEAGRPAR